MSHPNINRRGAALALALALSAGGAARAASPEPFAELLEASLKERKGIVIYVNGQAIAGRVTRLTAEMVELTSREYTRIVVRREAIDGVAGN